MEGREAVCSAKSKYWCISEDHYVDNYSEKTATLQLTELIFNWWFVNFQLSCYNCLFLPLLSEDFDSPVSAQVTESLHGRHLVQHV